MERPAIRVRQTLVQAVGNTWAYLANGVLGLTLVLWGSAVNKDSLGSFTTPPILVCTREVAPL